MRLTDADVILEEMCDGCNGEACNGNMGRGYAKCYARRLIEHEPTAYDVDRVVMDIEKFADCEDCRKRGIDKRFYYGMGCKVCAFYKIIDIVKRGGIDG